MRLGPVPQHRVRRWLSSRRLIRLSSANGSKRKGSPKLKYGSPKPTHQSGDHATAPTFGVSSAYEDWSPTASWQAAEERSRASSRRTPRLPQSVRVPTGRLPVRSTRALRYAACGLVLAVAGLFLVRAFHSRATHGTTNSQNVEAQTFAWVPVQAAKSYKVQFRHDGRVIYSSRTRQPRLRLRARWTYRAHRYALHAGVYQWYVWPIFRTAKGSHWGRPSVNSTLTIPD